MLRPLVFGIRSFVLVSVSFFRLNFNNSLTICVSMLLIFQMMIDLNPFINVYFQAWLDEPLLFISSGWEELYWNYFVSYKTISFLQNINGSSFL